MSKELKAALRRQALARRDALEPRWRIDVAVDLAETGQAAIPLEPGEVVAGFWPIRSEIDPRPLMYALQGKGARLCLPAILDRSTMVFRELVRGDKLVDMGFGTAGPADHNAVVDPSIILVPLAAFDARGHRIGYGAGYYDRAITEQKARGQAPRLTGLAFDCQEVPLVPDEPHDVVISAVLTESGLRRFGPDL